MARAKVSQNVVEVVSLPVSKAKISQDVIEVVLARSTVTALSSTAHTGLALSYPGTDSFTDRPILGSIARVNRLSPFFVPPAGASNVVVHNTTSPSDGGNLGVIAIDGGDSHFQNSPVSGNNYTFTLAADGVKAYFVYSFSGSTYRSGLTGAGTIDFSSLDPSGALIGQDVVEILLGDASNSAKVGQHVIEVLFAEIETSPSSGGGQHSSVAFG